jgi:amidase
MSRLLLKYSHLSDKAQKKVGQSKPIRGGDEEIDENSIFLQEFSNARFSYRATPLNGSLLNPVADMNIHLIAKTNYVFAMSPKNPAKLTVKPGDLIVVEARDGLHDAITTDSDPFPKIDWDRVNPATGPIYVENTEPGDTLLVDILDIQVGPRGVTIIIPGFGPLQDRFKKEYKEVVPIKDKFIMFPKGITIPVRPVIGTIGVAPSGGEITTLHPGPHGGNLDVADITIGSRVFFPVFVEGALLSLGDVKAAMGDGEVNSTGIEVAIRATIRVDSIKGKSIERPRVETDEAFMTIAMAKTLEDATELALNDMICYLTKETSLSAEEAYTLIGAAGNVRIGNVVDPEVTVRVSIPKSILFQARTYDDAKSA